MSTLTGNELINHALIQAGNITITTLAQDWLNNWLDRLYEDEQWDFLEKSTTGALGVGQTSVTLPADFHDWWDEHSLRLEDSNGKFTDLLTIDQDDFDQIDDITTQGSPPQYALVDRATNTWRPWRPSDRTYTWHLRYRYKPARITDFDDATQIIFPNDQLLIQCVYVDALRHEDDDRYMAAMQELLGRNLDGRGGMIGRYKKGWSISPTKRDNVRLNARVFKPVGNFR